MKGNQKREQKMPFDFFGNFSISTIFSLSLYKAAKFSNLGWLLFLIVTAIYINTILSPNNECPKNLQDNLKTCIGAIKENEAIKTSLIHNIKQMQQVLLDFEVYHNNIIENQNLGSKAFKQYEILFNGIDKQLITEAILCLRICKQSNITKNEFLELAKESAKSQNKDLYKKFKNLISSEHVNNPEFWETVEEIYRVYKIEDRISSAKTEQIHLKKKIK